MNKLLIGILTFSMLLSCEGEKQKEFKGYIVAKEFTPEHRCHEDVKTVNYALISRPIPVHVPHVPHVPHVHHVIEAEYIWYCANKHQIIKRFVSKKEFHSKKCGQKVSFYSN